MGAIKVHHTATVDKAWDGPAAKANLKNDGTRDYYRSAFAWEDPKEPDGDPPKKSDFKFIHHEISSDGKVGAANLTACSSGVAVLNGGRGGSDIPAGDRAGVHAHLAAHLKDAKKDVPELKSDSAPAREVRDFGATLELRDAQDGDGPGAKKKLVGYAAKFNSLSKPMGRIMPFREKIDSHAFDETLANGADVRFTMNHDPNKVMGRTAAGTLKLSTDATGLRFELEPPDSQMARDLMEAVKRGDISQCSFAFRTLDDDWTEDKDGQPVRTLKKVSLHDGDVSAVAYPAYPDTEVNARKAIQEVEQRGLARLQHSKDGAGEEAGDDVALAAAAARDRDLDIAERE